MDLDERLGRRVLAQLAFTERNAEELGTRELRVPITRDVAGYPEKYEYNDATNTLHVGDGEFAPVLPDVYHSEVSGLKVVQSWLGYRMKNPKGKKSSPLDEIRPEKWTGQFTTELLELLWILEATIAEYPAQARLLSAVVKKGMVRV